MLRRLLTLLTVLTLACASAHAYVPERSLLQAGELASQAKTAPRGFAATAATAAKEKSRASDCCIRENWHPPLKLASSMQFTGHYREREGSSYYAQQRYYRPGLGRFNRVDPWEGDPLRPITLNKYLYANGNPLAYVDPDGRIALLQEWQAWAAQAGEDSLAYADGFRGAASEASWYAQPGLAIGWGLSGIAYLTAGATEGALSGANMGANAVVIGTDWAGQKLGTQSLVAPLAAEGRAEIGQMVETIGPSIDALSSNPGEFIVSGTIASAERIGGQMNAAMAGDSRAWFELVANLVRRGGGGTERRMTQQAQPVTVVELGDGGAGAQSMVQQKGKDPAALLETGSYGDLASRSARDGMTPDHIPSHAARRTALERQLGRDLTPTEDRALRNQGNCLMVPTCAHQETSRTYGGRNTSQQIHADADDLSAAQELDLARWRGRLKSDGYSDSEIDSAFDNLRQGNLELGIK